MDRIPDGEAVSGLRQLELDFNSPGLPGAMDDLPGMLRRISLSNSSLSYRLVRARRRTIGIFVIDGQVQVRSPRGAPLAAVEAFMREKERWIARRLRDSRDRPPPFGWREGEQFPLLGRIITLRAGAGAAAIGVNGDALELPAHCQRDWRSIGLAWLQQEALATFHRRVEHYAAPLALPPPSLGLSAAKTRWGSCRRHGPDSARVLLNWRLVHLPLRLIDYVVAHELAHLRELNHSSRFWAVVAGMFADHAAARRELNRLGRALPVL